MRVLLFCLLAYIVIVVLKGFFANRINASKRPGLNRRTESEDMVLDPQCQTYLPRSEAILQEGRYFCSRECAKLYLTAKR